MTQPSHERPGNIILAALRVDLCQTTEQLSKQTGLDRKVVAKAAGTLIASGYAFRREIGCYVLSDDGLSFRSNGGVIKDGPNGPNTATRPRKFKKATSRDKIWQAMRMERKFGLDQLMTLTGCTERNLRKYIEVLARSGYLQPMAKRTPGTALTSPGHKRWLLLQDTGPMAPVWRSKTKALYDRNLEQEVPR